MIALVLLAQVATAAIPPQTDVAAAPTIALPEAPTVGAIPSLTKVDLLALSGYQPSGCVGRGSKARVRLVGPNGSVFVSQAAYRASSMLEPSPCEGGRSDDVYVNRTTTVESSRPTYWSIEMDYQCGVLGRCGGRGVEATVERSVYGRGNR